MRFDNNMKISRHSLRCVPLLFALVLLPLFASAAPAERPGTYLFYVGTDTEGGSKSKGIYAFRFDAATSEITPLGLAAETTNPSFVALHPNGRFLYAVNEVGNYKGPNSGGVSAFSIDRATGKLTFLNELPSRGADPCYITVDQTGKYVLVAWLDSPPCDVYNPDDLAACQSQGASLSVDEAEQKSVQLTAN